MCGLNKLNLRFLASFCVFLTLGFVQCTKPKVHYLRPIVLSSPDSRELFGCRINGKPFSPMASDSSLLGSCTYAPRYHGSSGFTFQVVGNRQQSSCEFASVTITLDSIELRQDRTYQLGTPGPKKNYASYFKITGCALSGTTVHTSDDLYGVVTITRLDPIKKIVNGEFDFRMRDADSNIIRISDGIFDRHYSEQ